MITQPPTQDGVNLCHAVCVATDTCSCLPFLTQNSFLSYDFLLFIPESRLKFASYVSMLMKELFNVFIQTIVISNIV